MASQNTKPKMTLYQFPFFRSFKPLWLIYELGVQDDFEIVTLDTTKKDTAAFAEYKKNVHPHGTIPALVVEGEGVILESSAICLYLADLYGKLAPPLNKRREYYDWMIYSSITIEDAMDFLYWQWAAEPRKSPDPEGVKKTLSKLEVCMTRLTKALEGRDYVCGEFSAADCVLGFNVWVLSDDSFNKGCVLKDFPAVQAYVKRVTERDGWKAAASAQGE